MNLVRTPTISPDEIALIGITVEATNERDRIVSRSRLILKVANPATLRTLTDIGTQIKRLLTDAEASRVDVKAPALRVVNTIDGLAKSFMDPLRTELARVNRMLTDYAVEQKRIADAAEAERLRVQREAQAKADAEAKRIEDEAKARARAAATPTEAQRTLDLAAMQAKQVVAAVPVAAPVAVRPTPGVSVTEGWDFKVTDLRKFAEENWDLVRIEPRVMEIHRRIAAGAREIPGLEIFKAVKAGISSR